MIMAKPILEESIDAFNFYEYDLFRPETLMLALPDLGLVGAIAGLHLVRELKMRDVVGIDSYQALPPVAVIIEGKPKHPIRIYGSQDGRLGVVLSDVPLAPPAAIAFSVAIVKYARSRGVRNILSVTGLGNPSRYQFEKPNLYVLSNDEETAKKVSEITGAKQVPGGVLVGPYAIVLKEASRQGLVNTVLLVDSMVDIPDPEASIVAVEAISKLYGYKVDTKKLEEEADKIKLRLKELMKETKSLMARMGKGYEYRPTLMYT